MKKIIYTGLLLVAAVPLLPMSVSGQNLAGSGTWTETRISGNQTVSLTGNVSVSGTITIPAGASLTINNGVNTEVTIRRTANDIIFNIASGGKLIINGKEGGMIVIDGGAGFSWNDAGWNARKQKSWAGCEYGKISYSPLVNGTEWTSSMVKSVGDIDFRHVRIQQFNAGTTSAGALSIAGTTDKCGKTTLTNCEMTLCRSEQGSAILVGNQNDNPDNDNENCALILNDVIISRCMINPSHTPGNEGGNAWGGVIRFKGKSTGSLKMTGCTMRQNYSTGDGSCLWWNAGGRSDKPPVLILNGCTFTDNRADRDAGAVRLESGFRFEGRTSVFENNSCGRYGGAIQVADYNGGAGNVKVTSFDYDLNELLDVKRNYAGEGGGGIAFYYLASDLDAGFTFNINMNGAKVTGNYAGITGGGIIFTDLRGESAKLYHFNVYLNGGTISDNSAVKAGGGIFVKKMDVSTNTEGDQVKITGNKVTAAEAIEEGGTGGGGGIAVYDGKLTLNTCTVTDNVVLPNEKTESKGQGGGILLNRSNFTMDGTNEISRNSANMGGGVAILNSSEDEKTVDLKTGIIKENTAHLAGGGVAVTGKIHVTITDIDITNNGALNAGGIFMRGRINDDSKSITDGKAILTYTGGDITGNKATMDAGDLKTTGYRETTSSITGMGGGVCVGGNSTLELLVQKQSALGIHDNIAEKGADDIFCSGADDSKVVLPGVASMTIDGGDRLFWVEDYITNDTEYRQGTCVNDAWNQTSKNIRYRNAVESNQMDQVYRLSQLINGRAKYSFNTSYNGSEGIYEIFDNKYVCLTLGTVMTYIILEKEGLEPRDNAIFKIFRGEIKEDSGQTPDDNEYEPLMTLILTDNDKAVDDGNKLRRKRIEVEYGYWYRVNETSWSWAYNIDPVSGKIEKRIDRNVTTVSERTFRFKNTPKEGIPEHAESVKVNKMPK